MPANKRSFNSPPATGGDSTKRVRFDSEDPVNDSGEFDFPTQKPKRGAVKDTSGYGSDSSDDEEGGAATSRKPQPSNADDEDDMFGATSAGGAGLTSGMPDLDAKANDTRVKDGGLQLKGAAAKGGKEFLDLGDIEGQEFTNSEAYASSSAGHNRDAGQTAEGRRKVTEDEEDYVEGEEHANDDDAIVPKDRKSADGMGFAISSFNMQDEMQEGRFSADGTYQANAKDPDAVHDQWLTSLTSKDLQAAALAKEKQEALIASHNASMDARAPSRIACLKSLIGGQSGSLGVGRSGLVKEGESVQGALARLGKARKVEVEEEKDRSKKERRSQNRPKKDFDAPDKDGDRHPASSTSRRDVETHDMDLDPLLEPNPSIASDVSYSTNGKLKAKESPQPTSGSSQLKEAIDQLTTLASTLLGTYGETGIYEETHEGIIRQLVAEGEVPRGWKPSTAVTGSQKDVGSNNDTKNGVIKELRQGQGSVVCRPVIARPKS